MLPGGHFFKPFLIVAVLKYWLGHFFLPASAQLLPVHYCAQLLTRPKLGWHARHLHFFRLLKWFTHSTDCTKLCCCGFHPLLTSSSEYFAVSGNLCQPSTFFFFLHFLCCVGHVVIYKTWLKPVKAWVGSSYHPICELCWSSMQTSSLFSCASDWGVKPSWCVALVSGLTTCDFVLVQLRVWWGRREFKVFAASLHELAAFVLRECLLLFEMFYLFCLLVYENTV